MGSSVSKTYFWTVLSWWPNEQPVIWQFCERVCATSGTSAYLGYWFQQDGAPTHFALPVWGSALSPAPREILISRHVTTHYGLSYKKVFKFQYILTEELKKIYEIYLQRLPLHWHIAYHIEPGAALFCAIKWWCTY